MSRSQWERDRWKVVTGQNRSRMLRRQARKAGMPTQLYAKLSQIRKEIAEQRVMANEILLVDRAERWAKRQDLNEEVRSEYNWCSSLRSAQVLRKYYSDPDSWSSRKKRRLIFERDGWRCRICGKRVYDDVPRDADNRAVAGHILARATGGEWTDENMCTLCHPCNVADGVNRTPIQTRLPV